MQVSWREDSPRSNFYTSIFAFSLQAQSDGLTNVYAGRAHLLVYK